MQNYYLLILTLALACPLFAAPAELTEEDKEMLEAKLEKIKSKSDERVGSLHKKAIRDFREAIKSDSAALSLYLECYEKVIYTDMKRKNSDFRNWKRSMKDTHSSPSLRMALRLQLSWLLLSIEAAHKEEDVTALAKKVIKHLDTIFDHADKLKDHRHLLTQNALSSVFAKAYRLNIKLDNWPSSTMNIAAIYDNIVMPPLRNPKKIDLLRMAWKKRVLHERHKIEKWNKVKNALKKDQDSAAMEKFLTETQPDLLWAMEIDCFKAGDELASSKRMLSHIEKYITHQNAETWIKELQTMVAKDKSE